MINYFWMLDQVRHDIFLNLSVFSVFGGYYISKSLKIRVIRGYLF
jgi:hypothetical protein